MPYERPVDGRFELLRLAASGGMGQVYEARDLTTGARVALKRLCHQSPNDVVRFAREAQMLAGLCHPWVVHYVAHGVTPEGEPYLAMDWIEGETLSRRLVRGVLGIEEGFALSRRLAEALGAVHRAGVVHRDLKPSNVILANGALDSPVLVDFGVALLSGADRLTHTGAIVGTAGYMAPEQARGAFDVDARADVFALGCVIFRCLTGAVPFAADESLAAMLRLLLDEPPRLGALRPGTPPCLEALVERMLAKQREHRPPDGDAVTAELEALGVSWGTPASLRPAVASAREITNSERWLMSLVLVRDLGVDPDATQVLSSVDEGATAPPWRESAPQAQALRAAAERHGGRVEALADGSRLVVLRSAGAPKDLAGRATRCALAMRAALGGAPVAVATGRAELEARLPVGELIDRAVCLLAAARAQGPAGPILVDEVTARLLGPRFELEPAADGFALHGERGEEPPPLLLGRPTACVGRDRELALLESAFAHCVEESSALAVLITAPAGLGKSRLQKELLRRLRARGEPLEVWFGRGDPLSAGAAFAMIARAIRYALGIAEGDPPAARRRRIQARLEGLPEAARVEAFLGELVGAPLPDDDSPQLRAARRDPQLMGDQLRRAAKDLLRAACAARPVVLVLEDLQWGDLPSVTFVDAALRTLADQPLLVIALARPEVQALFPQIWSGRPLQTLQIGGLPQRAAERLAGQALGDGVPPDQIQALIERADGNALYLEELIRAVAEGQGARLPETVLAMAQARLEALDAEARRILRAASVFGGAFSSASVEALLGGAPAGRRIDELVEREMLVRRIGPGEPAEVAYGFRHSLMREAAYAMLTEDDRAVGHRLAGALLEGIGHTDSMALAEHFERGREPARAAGHYRRAAEDALRGNDLAAALNRAERGAACGPSPEELGALRLLQAEAHLWRGDLIEAEAHAEEAATQLPAGSAGWFRALRQAAMAAGHQGSTDRLDARIEQVCALAEAPDTTNGLVLYLASAASVLSFSGRLPDSEALLERTRRLVCASGGVDDQSLGVLHEAEALCAMAAGDPAGALQRIEAAIDAFDRAGDLRNLCSARTNLGFVLAEMGDFLRAEDLLCAALADAERMGLHQVVPHIQENLGYVLAQVDRIEEARGHLERAIAALRDQGQPRMEGAARTSLARIALRSGDLAAAEREARSAAALLEVAPPVRASALALVARALLAQGRGAEALEPAAEAYAQLSSTSGLEEGEALVGLAYVEALAAVGQRADAARVLDEARARLLARADRLSDPTRRAQLLSQVPDHAALLAAVP